MRATARPSAPKTKVLLVRQPVKSVGPETVSDGRSFRLALITISALGAIAAVWIVGHLGHRLGFAPLVRVPHLSDDPIGALASGILMLLSIPRMVLQAGMARPELLMASFVLIAIPAATLGAVRPRQPGGPRASSLVLILSAIGAAAAGLNAALIVWWVASPTRSALIAELPTLLSEAQSWAENVEVAAGFDVLALIVAGLWVVLVTRLNIPLWLRALGLTCTLFACAVATVAMSASNGAATQIRSQRSVYADGDSHAMILGPVLNGAAVIKVDGVNTLVQFTDLPPATEVRARQSLVDFLVERAP